MEVEEERNGRNEIEKKEVRRAEGAIREVYIFVCFNLLEECRRMSE